MRYNSKNHYWIAAGSTTQVYSSAKHDFVGLTDDDYLAWLALGGEPTSISGTDMVRLTIQLLEDQQTPRRLREAAIGSDGGWLANLNSQIATLRGQLT